jgi:hypothetical protein
MVRRVPVARPCLWRCWSRSAGFRGRRGRAQSSRALVSAFGLTCPINPEFSRTSGGARAPGSYRTSPDRGLRPHGTASLSAVAKGRRESRAANRFGIVIGVEGGHCVGIRRSTRARWAWTSPPPASSRHPLLLLLKSALKQRRASPSAYNSGHGMVRDGPR